LRPAVAAQAAQMESNRPCSPDGRYANESTFGFMAKPPNNVSGHYRPGVGPLSVWCTTQRAPTMTCNRTKSPDAAGSGQSVTSHEIRRHGQCDVDSTCLNSQSESLQFQTNSASAVRVGERA
jgi:hypothetical protein